MGVKIWQLTSDNHLLDGLVVNRSRFRAAKVVPIDKFLLILSMKRQQVKCVSLGPLAINLGSREEEPKEGKKVPTRVDDAGLITLYTSYLLRRSQ